MSKHIDVVAEQLKADEQTRRSLQAMTANMNDKARKIIEWTYIDPELRSAYHALRNLDQTSKDKTRRAVIKFPNVYVYHFLNDLFKVKYGDHWLKDTKTLKKIIIREPELLKPWVIAEI